jgi:hypothetical protein
MGSVRRLPLLRDDQSELPALGISLCAYLNPLDNDYQW